MHGTQKKNKNGLYLLNENKTDVFIPKNYDFDSSFKLPKKKKFEKYVNINFVKVKNKANVLPLIAASAGLLGTFLKGPTVMKKENTNELVFEIEFENEQSLRDYVEHNDSYIRSQIMNVCKTNDSRSSNVAFNSLGLVSGSNNQIVVDTNQTISYLDYSKLNSNISAQINSEISKRIVNDVRTAFENQTVNSLKQQTTERNSESIIGSLSKMFSANDESKTIKNASTNKQDILNKIENIFNQVSKTLESITTEIDYNDKFNKESTNRIINELNRLDGDNNNLIFSNTQGINLMLNTITELNITEKIFSKINQLGNFQVKADTLNSLLKKSDQVADVEDKQEGISDVFKGFVTPLLFGGAALVGGYFLFSGSKDNKSSKNSFDFNNNKISNNNEMLNHHQQQQQVLINLSQQLPDSYFYDDTETNMNILELISERRRLLYNNKPFRTNKLKLLFDYFDSKNIDYSNKNEVLLSPNDFKTIIKTSKGVRFNEIVKVFETDAPHVAQATGCFPQTKLITEALFNM